VYFNLTRNTACGFSGNTWKSSMYPSSFKTRAMDSFTPEWGMDTAGCWRSTALRILVNMSAMGSVIDMILFLSPARLHDTGNIALQCLLAKMDAAQPEAS
jgi:hypothetical protein